MNREFKAHKLLTVTYIRPFVFILVLPVVKGAVQYLMSGEMTGIAMLEAAAAVTVLMIAFLKYRAFSLTVSEDALIIKSGIFIKTRVTLKTSKLSTVIFEQNPLDAMFRAVTCRVNTEAGRRDSADFMFKLAENDANELSRMLYGAQNGVKIAFSPSKIAIISAGTSSAISGIVFAVPIINRLGNLLDVAVRDTLINEINAVSNDFSTYFPPIVNAVTLIFLVSYGISFVISLLSYAKFKLQLTNDKIKVSSGVVIRRVANISKNAVNGILTEQSPVMRFFGRYCIRVSAAGHTSRSRRGIVIPSMNRADTQGAFSAMFDEYYPNAPILRAARRPVTRWRFGFMPRVLGIIIIGSAAAAVLFFPAFKRVVLFITLVLVAADLYYAYLCRLDFKQGGIFFGNTVCAQSSHIFTVRRLNCKKERIGEIKLTRTPADRFYNTCKIKIALRSEKAESVRVKMIDMNAVNNGIYKEFGIIP